MNVFEAVKQTVTTRQAAENYGIRVNRAGKANCPFHNDRTPSMKVDKRFHCFGCGADGDVIDFTAQLFGLDLKSAAEKLAADFQISYTHHKRKETVKKSIRENQRSKCTGNWKSSASGYYQIIFICSGIGDGRMPQNRRMRHGIHCLWKHCKRKTTSSICWMCCCTIPLKIVRHLSKITERK